MIKNKRNIEGFNKNIIYLIPGQKIIYEGDFGIGYKIWELITVGCYDNVVEFKRVVKQDDNVFEYPISLTYFELFEKNIGVII